MGATIYVASTTSSTTSTARLWWALNGQGQLRRVEAWAVGGLQASRPAIYLASTIGTATTSPTYVSSWSLVDNHVLTTTTSGGWLPSAQWLTNPLPNPTVESINVDPTYAMNVTNSSGTASLIATAHWNYNWPEGVGPTAIVADNGAGTLETLPIVVVMEVVGAGTSTATAGVNLYWQPLIES